MFFDYFYWHYAIAPLEILKIMASYLKAAHHQFLIVQHFRTLLAPWHRQNPSDFGPKERTLTDKIIDPIVDLYIRLIAAVIRLTIIIAGLVWQLVLLIAFLILFVTWLAWPLISIYLVIKGLTLVQKI